MHLTIIGFYGSIIKGDIMATLTAFIFIGTSHPNHGGINPSHYITLSENSRPCLQLKMIDNEQEIIRIIPTVENMIDDIYFLIYSFIFKKKYTNYDFHLKEMYELFDADERNNIYNEVKTELQGMDIKVVFNILDGSTLLDQLDKIKQYPNNYEVTTPIFRKEFNQWSGKTEYKDYR